MSPALCCRLQRTFPTGPPVGAPAKIREAVGVDCMRHVEVEPTDSIPAMCLPESPRFSRAPAAHVARRSVRARVPRVRAHGSHATVT